jgi:putative hydrolase of the HAD superfamily
MLSTIFFDLDDTLYPRGSQVMYRIGERIQMFIAQTLNVSAQRAKEVRSEWREKYGTALRAMMEENVPFDREHFFNFVHDINLDGVLYPDPAVRQMLLGLPLRRAVLTNANVEHARRILAHLRLADCFERIVDIRAMNYVNKPYDGSYQTACALMGVAPAEAILVEDLPVNTRAAMALGMKTILVDCPPSADADIFVDHVREVSAAARAFDVHFSPK